MENENINKFMFRAFNPSSEAMIPQYQEIENRLGWINYGEDNLYPQYLVGLMNRSSRHSAILKTKAQMIGGAGFNKDGSTMLINFLKNSRDTYDCDELLHRYAYDLEIYGGFFINVIWSKDRSTISQISYIDPLKVRISVPDKNGNKGFWISQDWSKLRRYPPDFYPAFSIVKKQKASQILYIKEYRPGIEFYAQPEYLAAVNWVEMEWEVSQYHLSNIKNGWSPSYHVNFASGIPSEEEMDMSAKRLKDEFAGSLATGRVVLTYSEGTETAPTLTPMTSNGNDETFIKLLDDIESGIYQGHRITNTSLFGVKTPGELGNTNEILESLSVFQTQYVNNKQLLIEKVFNDLLKINNIQDKIKINKYKLKLEPQLQAKDITDLLSSTIENDQKRALLSELGYSDEVIDKLVPENAKVVITDKDRIVSGDNVVTPAPLDVNTIKASEYAGAISFDYDNTLSTGRGKQLAKSLNQGGTTMYIISARSSKDGMLQTAKEIGIPENRVFATGSNEGKIRKIKELHISKHYDDNRDVISLLHGVGVKFSEL